MTYQPLNCTPADINTLRSFLKKEKGYIGVGEDGLYDAHKNGPNRVSRAGVSFLADQLRLSVKIQTGTITDEGLSVLADWILDQYR